VCVFVCVCGCVCVSAMQSTCRCGSGEPSPGADVAAVGSACIRWRVEALEERQHEYASKLSLLMLHIVRTAARSTAMFGPALASLAPVAGGLHH
jgi:hypothetical protein